MLNRRGCADHTPNSSRSRAGRRERRQKLLNSHSGAYATRQSVRQRVRVLYERWCGARWLCRNLEGLQRIGWLRQPSGRHRMACRQVPQGFRIWCAIFRSVFCSAWGQGIFWNFCHRSLRGKLHVCNHSCRFRHWEMPCGLSGTLRIHAGERLGEAQITKA